MRRLTTFALLLTVVALTVALATACKRQRASARHGVLTVSVEQQASWVRNFNPLVAAGGARWPTLGGVYEPLLIFNSVQDRYEPWLATGHHWGPDNRSLHFETRRGVKWSDGQPFSAQDVVYTFKLLKTHPAMDTGGVWAHLSDVTHEGDALTFTFKHPFVPALQAIAHQVIVPEHVWSKVEDPVAFANEDPVGTGAFTEILTFQNQIYELGRNPYHWNRDQVQIEALRFPAFPSNDQANLALVSGEVDWAGNFVPAIDRIFVDRDPEHHGYWFPLMGSTVFLYPNTTKAPFDRPEVRKALSMALDREQMVKVAMYNYTRPADVTGLSETFDAWRDASVVEAHRWTDHDPDKANALLDAAGLKRGPDGVRRDEQGEPLSFELIVVSGWSDWVRAAQITARNLSEIGVETRVKTYDFGAWFNKLQTGQFDLAISWSVEGQTPYDFYRWLMSSKTVKPVGETSGGNWHRFAEPRADDLFATFEITSERKRQQALASQLQALFAEQAPAIPLFPNPAWGAYNSARFEGFPTASDPYAQLSPNKLPESILVLTRLQPRTTPNKTPLGRR